MSHDEEIVSKKNPLIPLDDENLWKDGWVSPPLTVGRRMLYFPDNTKVSVFGLDDIMAELFAENRKANYDTAEEIIRRLIEKKNFIPSSITVRREYAYALLMVYRKYIEER